MVSRWCAMLLILAVSGDEFVDDENVASLYVTNPNEVSCDASSYFNTALMRCASCSRFGDVALVADFRTSLNDNALTCRCPIGSVESTASAAQCLSTDGTCRAVTCTVCPVTSYSDNSGCATCGAGAVFDPEDGDCRCSDANSVLVERTYGAAKVAAKFCVACGAGYFASPTARRVNGVDFPASKYECNACPGEFMGEFSNGACGCELGYVLTGLSSVGRQFCVPAVQAGAVTSDYPVESAIQVVFAAVQNDPKGDADGFFSVESATFEHYFEYAAARCSYHDGTSDADEACQILGNLCVLTLYRMFHPVCVLYSELAGERGVRSAFGTRQNLPFLTYTAAGEDVRKDGTLQTEYSFGGSGGDSVEHRMKLRLFKYNLNGTLAGVSDLSTELFYCGLPAPDTHKGGGASRSTKWLQYAHSTRDHFRCDLSTLLGGEQYLYELFVVDAKTNACGDVECLYPVPVLIKNYISSFGTKPNKNSKSKDEDGNFFVRRFALYDLAAGVDASTDLLAVRYLVSMKLLVVAKPRSPRKIYTPVIELKYRERRPVEWLSGKAAKEMREVRIDFSVEYSMESSRFWNVSLSLFVFVMAISVVIWIFGVRLIQAQSYPGELFGMMDAQPQDSVYSLYSGFRLLVLYARIFVHCVFPFVFFQCSYLFVFFKLQEAVYILLPPEDKLDGRDQDYYPIRTLIIVMWVFQTVVVLSIVYDQCSHEIFFLDWERPRQPVSSSAPMPVSTWRTIFVANEWNEMQTQRKTSTHFILICLCFFLIYLGLENNATAQPDLNELESGHLNLALRFANTTWYWLLLAAVQWLWNFFIYERFISEPRAQSFVDVCTVAKISILVLDTKFHGYYIHGDSPYPHADDTMAELTRHLVNEANAESVARGLDSTLPDVQTFEVWLTPHFRRAWDSVHAKVSSAASGGDGDNARLLNNGNNYNPRPSMGARLFKREQRSGRTERAQAMEKLSAFLRTFLAHGYTERFDLDWTVRVPTRVERLTWSPPPLTGPKGPVVMQPDYAWFGGDNSWTSATFLGHDYELLLHEILTFAVVDIWFKSAALSILCTFLLHHLVRLIRALAGEQNLSDRTLVDSRFLI